MIAWLKGLFAPRRSGAEAIEERLMREGIVPDPAAMEEALGDDDEARALIKEHRLYVAFNWITTEPRWEVQSATNRTYFCPEYKYDYDTLGDAVRACVKGW